ncbi:MAG TPA: MBL fold metallo-hydrolase [Pedomonas sp.]|uniref:MBL fold metallo-hydrolase n=1 Tax=Pedomonas sp. TaxID=2976421 RepID=UPI002F3F3B8C
MSTQDTSRPTPPIQVTIVPVTPFQQNCSLVWCTRTMRGAFIDAGGDIDQLLAAAEQHGVQIEKLLVTHGHLDHCGVTAELAEKLGVPIEGPHEDDLFWIEGLEHQAKSYGFPPARSFVPDRWLHDNDTVTVGEQTFQVRHCPGHTPGHVIFYHEGVKLAFVGDVLFQGSIGRTDFPKGNLEDLVNAITTRLWPLGDDVHFVPGHGPMSTFGQERRSNPFVSDSALRQRA